MKPQKKDLGLVDAFGVALNPKASLRGWLVREDGYAESLKPTRSYALCATRIFYTDVRSLVTTIYVWYSAH